MAITTNTQTLNVQRTTGNMTSGNEVIMKVDPRFPTALDAVLVSGPGVAQVFASTDPNYDAATNGFTEMGGDEAGAPSNNHTRVVAAGACWIGLKVTSGTWKMNVRQHKQAFVG